MKDRGCESFRPNLVYKTKQSLQLAWQTPRSIEDWEEQVRRGLFADHYLFAVSVFFFFQHSSVQLLKRTNDIEKQILELWADSERRTANNMVSKTTYHVRQAISMVVGWTGESGCQESTVKPVKQGGQSP